MDESFNNEFERQLKDAGYKWFKDHLMGSYRGFQRRIADEYGIRYFITGYQWKRFQNDVSESSYTFSPQFELPNGAFVTIEYTGDFIPNKYGNPVINLSEVESFYEKFWWDNNCNYYEKF